MIQWPADKRAKLAMQRNIAREFRVLAEAYEAGEEGTVRLSSQSVCMYCYLCESLGNGFHRRAHTILGLLFFAEFALRPGRR